MLHPFLPFCPLLWPRLTLRPRKGRGIPSLWPSPSVWAVPWGQWSTSPSLYYHHKACRQATALPHTKPVRCSRHRHVWMRHRRNCAIRLICGAWFRRMIFFIFIFYHLRERLNPPRICLSSTIKWKQEGWWISTLSHIDHLSVSRACLGGCRRNYITVAGQWISGFSALNQAECRVLWAAITEDIKVAVIRIICG